MKKFKLFILSLFILLCLTGCDFNYQVLDTNYSYDYAIINTGEEVKKIEIKSWRDYEDGDQIQITAKDGAVYLVHSVNITLVKE